MSLRQPEVPKNDFFFCFFRVLYDKILKVSITRELYIKLDWLPFKMTKKTIFLLVFNTIYTSRTKRNVLKWVFQDFFWMRIYQDFFQNIIDYNIHGNQKDSRKNQLFHCRNYFLQEFTSSSIFAYYSTLRTFWEFIFASPVFLLFFVFLLLLVFSLPWYFLVENGINPVFSFIMLYLKLHR